MTAANRSLVFFTAIALAIVAVTVASTRSELPPWTLTVIPLVSVCALFGGFAHWWRSADEAVREAHKSAWFWGGTLALIPLIAVLLLVRGNAVWLAEIDGMAGEFGVFGAGVLLTLILQLTGYLAAWAVWWLRRR